MYLQKSSKKITRYAGDFSTLSKRNTRLAYRVHISLSVYVLIDLSPLNPPILGTLKEFYFLIPPELGARGRLIVDLTGFYGLCVHGSPLLLAQIVLASLYLFLPSFCS